MGRAAAGALALLLVAQGAAGESGFGDPTRPTSLSEPGPVAGPALATRPRWRLQSTLVADSRRVAVINGRAVAEGENVDGARLVDVQQDGVTLDVEGRRIQLRMLPASVDVKRSGG